MSQAVFPPLKGLEYPVLRTAEWSNLRQVGTSGLDVTAALWSYPIWHWTLSFSWLSSAAAIADFQTLAGFFNLRQGIFDTFLYSDPDDNAVTAQGFGTGNGVKTAFQLVRAFGNSVEPIFNVNGAPAIYVNSVLKILTTDYTISATGLVTFTSAPANGAVLTWTGAYYFRCRFEKDSHDFSLLANQIYESKKLSFRSVKGS